MPNTKPTIAEMLLSMPNVGEDADFARVDASAEAAIDDALAEVDASSPQIENMDRKAVEKQRKEAVEPASQPTTNNCHDC